MPRYRGLVATSVPDWEAGRKLRAEVLEKTTQLDTAAQKSQKHVEHERSLERQIEEAKRTGAPQVARANQPKTQKSGHVAIMMR